jgi:AcrR family transcriptional regulator
MSEKKKFTRNKQQKIDLIVNVAQDLIREKGYDKLSTNHIADRAKIGIGTIYRNFPNGKEDIMREIVIRDSSIVINLDLFNNIVKSDLSKTISQIIKNFIEFHRQNVQFDLALERALQSNKELAKDFRLYVEEALTEVVKQMNQIFPIGNVTEIELKEKLFLVYNVVESIIRRHILITPLFNNDEELGIFLTDLTLNILKFDD